AEVDVETGLKPSEVISIIGKYQALIVRSQTDVTDKVINAGKKLSVIGRAGVGVDNIDLETATLRGIAVVNAPVGNIIAAAEHTVGLLLALARNIPQANSSLKSGNWDRGAFTGVELRGKNVGIIGLGKVGSEVARRLSPFQVSLFGYDPYISPNYAKNLGIELLTMDQILKNSDFITLHLPLTESTRNLIGDDQLRKMKPSVRVINAARGGLINEDALYQAIITGKIAGAAIDVFEKEPPGDHPLLKSDKVIVTPHLGAYTAEAQRDIALEVAEQVLAVLRGQSARYTVNSPFISPEIRPVLMPYIQVANYVGKVATQLAEGQVNSINIYYQGEIAEQDVDILKSAALVGLLTPVTDERVNLVNAQLIANQRGFNIAEHKEVDPEPRYASMISVELGTSKGKILVGGTAFRDIPHIIRVNEYWLDLTVAGPYILAIN
ncbi:MAG: phosphoglycerate dehydrogenase, partial [Anaerolineales bacterium]|nr:phosphoglycerate dehydrogenase [Anaerolineales bacterium]